MTDTVQLLIDAGAFPSSPFDPSSRYHGLPLAVLAWGGGLPPWAWLTPLAPLLALLIDRRRSIRQHPAWLPSLAVAAVAGDAHGGAAGDSGLDSDGDGLPDAWEFTHRLNAGLDDAEPAEAKLDEVPWSDDPGPDEPAGDEGGAGASEVVDATVIDLTGGSPALVREGRGSLAPFGL